MADTEVTYAVSFAAEVGQSDLYRFNRARLKHQIGTEQFITADAALRQHLDAMAIQRDAELVGDKLRDPCRKALVSLTAHWSGLTLFVDDARIPLDNNYGERLIRLESDISAVEETS